MSSPANRIIKPDVRGEPQARVAHSRGAQAKGWLVKLSPSVRSEVLKSHAIPEDAYEALVNNDPAEFIRRRQQYLIDLERRFMEREGVALPSDTSTPQLSPIDTDDVAPPLDPIDLDDAQPDPG